MSTINKLLPDFKSQHIIMVHPYMYEGKHYFIDLVDIYKNLNKIFLDNSVSQTIVLDQNSILSDYYIGSQESDIRTIYYNCDDVWIRDFMPKLYICGHDKKRIDYQFNAYGEKYPHNRDKNFKNVISISKGNVELNDLVLEGGNLEFSSKGIITNMHAINKNNIKKNINIEQRLFELKESLEVEELLFIWIPGITGDDTNGHIDNLVRYIDENTIVYFASKDKKYCNYKIAYELEKQIDSLISRSKSITNAFPIYHNSNDVLSIDSKVLPYSKLNFILTKNVLVIPCINSNKDSIYSDLDKIHIKNKTYVLNSEAALFEYGGLHCLTANI